MFYISDQICMSTLTEIMRLNTTESPVPHKINVTFKCQYNDTYVASLEEICNLYAFPTTILSCPVPSRKRTHSSCPYVLFFNILIYKYIHLHMSFLILASAQTSKLVEAQKRQKKPWVGYKARSNPVDQIINERTQTHVKSNPWWKPKNWVKCPWQHLILTASILCFNKLHNRVQLSCWFTKKWCQHWADIISLWTFFIFHHFFHTWWHRLTDVFVQQ